MAEGRLLLVDAMAPPHPGGTAVVLHRLLSGLEGVDLEVVADRSIRPLVAEGGQHVLPGRYRYVARAAGRLTAIRLAREGFAALNVPLAVVAGVRAGVLARRSRARWVMSVVDGGFSQLAGAIAARIARRPFVLLVFDLWEENAYGRVDRWLGRRLERRLQRGAAAVLVFCQAAAEHYRDKHGTDPEVLATPIEPPPEPAGAPEDEGEVLVAGSLYWAQEEAVRRLLSAAAEVEGARVTILGDEANLRQRGFEPDRFEPPVPAAEFAARAARAGVLFVGLSFDSPHPAVARTATPARLADYMATGRPILVHAPPDSHVARYARDEDFAAVCDSPDVAALARTLRGVLEDPDRAAEGARRARALALERHAATAVCASLASVLERI